jgi:hypothetical protein
VDCLRRIAKPWNRQFSVLLIVAAGLALLTLAEIITAQDRVKFPVGVGTKTLGNG